MAKQPTRRPRKIGARLAHTLEDWSRSVTTAGRGHHAISADLYASASPGAEWGWRPYKGILSLPARLTAEQTSRGHVDGLCHPSRGQVPVRPCWLAGCCVMFGWPRRLRFSV